MWLLEIFKLHTWLTLNFYWAALLESIKFDITLYHAQQILVIRKFVFPPYLVLRKEIVKLLLLNLYIFERVFCINDYF